MRLRDDLVLRKIANDYVIVDQGQDMVDMSKVFTLNESAAWLWSELKEVEFTSQTMENLLIGRYEVTLEQAKLDVQKLIAIFVENGLLQ